MKRILIADDSKTALIFIERIVLHLFPEAQVIRASSGEEALEHLDSAEMDLVLLDHNMGGMTGIECGEQILAQRPGTRVVLCTANVQRGVRDRAQGCGLLFVEKPLNPKKLAAVLGV